MTFWEPFASWFWTASPVQQALVATSFTWFVTALGAGLVLFTRLASQRLLDASLGMAAGVMIAASFWSLLQPAIALSEESHPQARWLPPLIGFLLGALTIRAVDIVLPHLHPDLEQSEGVKTSWQRSTLLVLAITLHNIPEGLAVGVAFGAAGLMTGAEHLAQLQAAIALTLGIGLQNFPEGAAVSLPLRREGMGRGRALAYGQASALVEPVAGMLGAWLVLQVSAILPYALAFAAGAMIFVVAEELIPESQRHGNVDLATMALIVGFAVMMVLDVALG